MNLPGNLVGSAGQDGEGGFRGSSVRIPFLIESCEEQQPAVLRMKPDWRARLFRPAPFVEPVGRHQTSTLLEGLAKRGLGLDRLSHRIDALRGAWVVSGAAIYQAPSRGQDFAALILRG